MRITIHREGRKIISLIAVFLIILNYILYKTMSPGALLYSLNLVSLLLMIFIFRFFRKPERIPLEKENIVFSAADGKVVAIEEVEEKEYFKQKKLMISVFMSVWDVHINWFPVTAFIKYYRYHPGKYLVARHPKSSELNERTTVVLETAGKTEILIRQIAGFVARRIKFYSKEGSQVVRGEEMGFIKFGSRVDIYLPPDSEVLVKPGDKVKGLKSPLVMLKKT